MATVTNTTRTRKPVSRTVRVVEQPTPDTDGWGALEITVDGKAATYLCRFIPCEFGDGILGLELEKMGSDLTVVEERYHTVVGGTHTNCECKGFLRWRRCKHTAAAAKLVQLGALTPPAFPSRFNEVA